MGATLLLGILALATLPPFVGPGVRGVLMDAFAGVCHQLPDRSPHIHGIPLAVCHRCFGIYVGLLSAAPLFPLLAGLLHSRQKQAPVVLVASLVPIGIDWLLDAFHVVKNVPLSRAVTGWIFGLVAGYYLLRAIDDLVHPATDQSTSGRVGVPTDVRSAGP